MTNKEWLENKGKSVPHRDHSNSVNIGWRNQSAIARELEGVEDGRPGKTDIFYISENGKRLRVEVKTLNKQFVHGKVQISCINGPKLEGKDLLGTLRKYARTADRFILDWFEDGERVARQVMSRKEWFEWSVEHADVKSGTTQVKFIWGDRYATKAGGYNRRVERMKKMGLEMPNLLTEAMPKF